MNNLALVADKCQERKTLCVNQDYPSQNIIRIQGRNHNRFHIEMIVQQSHPALKRGSGIAFSMEVNHQERLVVVQEVKRNYLLNLDMDTVVRNIRSEISRNNGLPVYAIALLKANSIPKTSSDEFDYHTCQDNFLNGSLNAIHIWIVNPQQDLLQLQADIDALFIQIETCASDSAPNSICCTKIA